MDKRQLTQRIDALAALSEQMETRTLGLHERLKQLGEAQQTLADTGAQLEQRGDELAGRVVDEAGRIAVQVEKSESDQERLAALIQEVSQNGMGLSAVIRKLDSLQESGGQLELSML